MNYIIDFLRFIYIACRLLSCYFLHNNFATLFSKLGPVFIKLGQNLSVRPDIVGTKNARDFSLLQDRLKQFSHKKVIEIIERDFNCKLSDVFSEFDLVAHAAASVAQVHRAKTLSGEIVAVKVLRPGIEKKFQRDIHLLFFLAFILEKFSANSYRMKLIEIVKIFQESVRFELDLRFEAAHACELKENNSEIYIPQVYWELTAQHVLTLEWLHGQKITEISDNYDLAAQLAIMFFKQAYCNGFFHADLHSGNILVMENKQLALVDFGIMGRLSERDRIYMVEIFRGFLSRDYEYVAKIHFIAGYVAKEQKDFITACRAIGEPVFGKSFASISMAKLLGQLFKVAADFDMRIQPQLFLLQKTMLIIEGICSSLYANINMWELMLPYMRKWSKKNLTLRNKIKNIYAWNIYSTILNKVLAMLPQKQSTFTVHWVTNILLIVALICLIFKL